MLDRRTVSKNAIKPAYYKNTLPATRVAVRPTLRNVGRSNSIFESEARFIRRKHLGILLRNHRPAISHDF
jgi:hypothetical protein